MNTLERIIAERGGYDKCSLSCEITNNIPTFTASFTIKGDEAKIIYRKNFLFELIEAYEGKNEFITLLYDYQDIFNKGTRIEVKKVDVKVCMGIIVNFVREHINEHLTKIEFKDKKFFLYLSDRTAIPELDVYSLLAIIKDTRKTSVKGISDEEIKKAITAVEDIWNS